MYKVQIQSNGGGGFIETYASAKAAKAAVDNINAKVKGVYATYLGSEAKFAADRKAAMARAAAAFNASVAVAS